MYRLPLMVFFCLGCSAPPSGSTHGDVPGEYILVDNEVSPVGLALGTDRLYWTSSLSGSVRTISLDGGAPATLSLEAGSRPVDLAVTNDTLYWTAFDAGRVMVWSQDEGVAAVATDQSKPTAIAANASTLYWTTSGSVAAGEDADEADGAVYSCALDGDDVLPLRLTSKAARPLDLIENDGELFWTEFGLQGAYEMDQADDGKVVVLRRGSDEPEVLSEGNDRPQGLAVDAEFVYWVNRGGKGSFAGSVLRVPRKGGDSESLLSGLDQPLALTLDSHALYVATFGTAPGTGEIHRITLQDNKPDVLLSGIPGPEKLIVHQGKLFVTVVGNIVENQGFVVAMPVKPD